MSGTRGDGNAPLRSLSAALLLSVGLALAPVVARADSLALWRIVHDACEPHAEAGEGPKPCENVNLARGEAEGIAILKDLHGVVQMLAIPTRRITGIEDPQMLAPDAPNVFADAWKAKALLEERLGRPLPRKSVALTINSKWARSQEQLHVHVDCLAKSVAEKLEDYRSALDDRWRAMTVALNGRIYFARRLELDGSFGRRTAQTARRWHRGRQRSYGRLFAGCGWRDFRRKARVHPARRQLFAGGPWPRRGPSGPRLRDHGFWAMNRAACARALGVQARALSDQFFGSSLAVVASGHEQPVPLFQQLARDNPSGGADVREVPAVAAQRALRNVGRTCSSILCPRNKFE